MDLETRLAQMRRATVGKNALDVLALLFLIASGAFWAVLHWSALVVDGAGIPQMVVAVVMTAIYALALPLLLSMLAPSTPAGMLLQKTQWRTIGFALIIGSAAFLGWHAKNLMLLWFSAQPLIDAADQEMAYTIACLIGFVAIPALAWVQATPEQWLSAIQQAHAVRKLELEQNGEIAIIKARLLWAEERAAVSYAELLPAEQQEVRATLEGLFKAIADTQRDIARTVGARATVERGMRSLGDQEIAVVMSNIAAQLEKPAQDLDRYLAAPSNGAQIDAPGPAKPAQEPHTESYEPDTKSYKAARVALTRPDTARDGNYTVAYEAFGGEAWKVSDLAGVLNVAQSTAREQKIAWEESGLISGRGLSNGRYRFIDIMEA